MGNGSFIGGYLVQGGIPGEKISDSKLKKMLDEVINRYISNIGEMPKRTPYPLFLL